MKLALCSFLTVFMLIAFAEVSESQMAFGRPPDMAGVFNPVVGNGASYDVTKKNGEKTNFDIYVVDKESGGYWVEYTFQNPQEHGSIYAKILLAHQGDDVVVQRTIVQMPGQSPMDMSSMPRAMQSRESKADMRSNAQDMGTETVTTPAGSFSCQHWRDKKNGDDYWISDKVTPWQLVKMTGTDKNTVILAKVITGAKTHITGTPVSMQDMMRGMGRPNQ